jgi:ubiquinone/menaquinone biosynthesis C-methylase UbiE
MTEIRFEDGAAYETFMGVWSRKVGEIFLDWLKPEKGLRWIDVGCGNGAFTELLVARCEPEHVLGVDPSEAQLAYARQRHRAGAATFVKGDAMALPAKDQSFDAAVMALVIFFVPEPAKGVAEMARAVKPGGHVAAYAWDMAGGGFPIHVILEELERLGIAPPRPPSPDASRLDALRDLWAGAGLTDIGTEEITVQRSFQDFEDFWRVSLSGPSMSMVAAGLSPDTRETLKASVRARLSPESQGPITCQARANAICGRVRR